MSIPNVAGSGKSNEIYLVPNQPTKNLDHLAKLNAVNRNALTEMLVSAASPTDITHKATAVKTTAITALAAGSVIALREGFRRAFLENNIIALPKVFCATYIANDKLNSVSTFYEKAHIWLGYGQFSPKGGIISSFMLNKPARQIGDGAARAALCFKDEGSWAKRAVILERSLEAVSEVPQWMSNGLYNIGQNIINVGKTIIEVPSYLITNGSKPTAIINDIAPDASTFAKTVSTTRDVYNYFTTLPNSYDLARIAHGAITQPTNSLYIIVPVASITAIGLYCLYNYKFKSEQLNQKKEVTKEIDTYLNELADMKVELLESRLEFDTLDDKAFAKLHKTAKGILDNMPKIKSNYTSVAAFASKAQNERFDELITKIEKMCTTITTREPVEIPAEPVVVVPQPTFMESVANKINETITATADGFGKNFEKTAVGVVKVTAGYLAVSMLWDSIFK